MSLIKFIKTLLAVTIIVSFNLVQSQSLGFFEFKKCYSVGKDKLIEEGGDTVTHVYKIYYPQITLTYNNVFKPGTEKIENSIINVDSVNRSVQKCNQELRFFQKEYISNLTYYGMDYKIYFSKGFFCVKFLIEQKIQNNNSKNSVAKVFFEDDLSVVKDYTDIFNKKILPYVDSILKERFSKKSFKYDSERILNNFYFTSQNLILIIDGTSIFMGQEEISIPIKQIEKFYLKN